MKYLKKLLAFIIVFSILLSCMNIQVFASEHCSHTEVFPTGSMRITTSGNYYLKSDVTLTRALSIQSGAVVNLCLNGHILNGSSNTITVNNGGELNIYDCGNTVHYFKYYNDRAWELQTNANDNAIEIDAIDKNTNNGDTIKIYGGCITKCRIDTANDNSKLNIYNGTFVGSSGDAYGIAISGSYGQINIYSGCIVGNRSAKGGAIYAKQAIIGIGGNTKIVHNINGNAYLYGNAKIKLLDNRSSGLYVGISLQSSIGQFTTDSSCTKNDAKYFFSDNSNYSVACDANGNLILTDEASCNHANVETIAGRTATCTETGLTEGKKCSVCGEILEAQQEIQKKPHTEEIISGKDATCTETGLTEGKKCSVCGEILEAQQEIQKKPHTEEIISGKAATCIETGLTEGKKCSVCGEILEAQQEIQKKPHTEEIISGKAATCIETGLTEGKKCSICGEILKKQEIIQATGHTIVNLPKVEATCTNTGLTKGRKCSVCGEIIIEQEIIDKKSHSFTLYKSDKNATCTSDGTETATCDNCDATYTRVAKNSKTEHTIEIDAMQPATCTVNGLTEGSHCTVCGTTIKKQNIIPATGHSFTKYTSDKNETCTSDGTETAKCDNCDETYTRVAKNSKTEHTIEIDAMQSATCTVNGLTEGSHCTVCGTTIKKQNIIPATGHSFTKYTSDKNATCTSDGTETAKCDNCDETYTRVAKNSKTEHTIEIDAMQPATCTVNGLTEGSHCTVCGTTIKKQNIIPATGHSFTKYTSDKNATCTSDGTETAKCDNCDETYTRVAKNSKTEHTIEIDTMQSATCTVNGLTEGSHCAVCGTTIKKRNIIPATRHSFTKYTSDKNATCTSDGTETAKCDNCDETYTRVAKNSKTEHTIEIDAMQSATCTVNGLTEGSHCTVCGTTIKKQNIIPATGHSFTKYTSDNNATCTSDGTETAKCDNCDATYTRIVRNSKRAHSEIANTDVEATCTTSGTKGGTHCSVCGQSVKKAEIIPATGHSFSNYISDKNATCISDGTETAKCDNCDATYTRIVQNSKLAHSEIANTDVEATCTTSGTKGGTHCSVCEQSVKKAEIIPATGHNFSNYISDNNATCTSDGTETAKCDNCDATYTRIVQNSKLAHSEIANTDVEATCTTSGTKGGTYCSVCGQSIKKAEIIPATGHSFSNYISDNNATCTSDGTETAKCDNCDATYTRIVQNSKLAHSEIANTDVEATCTTSGTKGGTHCSVCEQSVKKAEIIPATGHSFSNYISDKNATCTSDGTETAKCDNCDATYTRIVQNSKLAHSEIANTDVEATCTTSGTKGGTYCSVCGQSIKKAEIIPATGHSFSNYISDKNATCTSDGTETANCDNCNATYTRIVQNSKLSHTEVANTDVEATCTTSGTKGGTHCSVCGQSVKKAEIIPATGHSFSNYISDNNATCTSDGTETAKCDNCDATYTRIVKNSKLAHTEVANTDVEATCTTSGTKDGTHCSVCGQSVKKAEIIPATGHSFSNYKSDNNATCANYGTKTATCDYCGTQHTTIDYTSKLSHSEVEIKGYDATCTMRGLTSGIKCSVCNTIIKEREEIPATGHSFGDYVSDNNATCTSCGTKTAICEYCGSRHTIKNDVGKLEHNEIEVLGYDATCTESGLSNGTKCAICGETIVEQVEIPAKGHSEITLPEQSATSTSTGLTSGVKCSVCGEILVEQEIIPILAEDEISITNNKADDNNQNGGSANSTAVFDKSINKNIYISFNENTAFIKWNKISNASGYEVYMAVAEHPFDDEADVTITKNNITSVSIDNLDKSKSYTAVIKAYKKINNSKVYISESLELQVVNRASQSNTNIKKLNVKRKITMSVGDKHKIRVSAVKYSRKKKLKSGSISKYRYFSDNEDVATVDENGIVRTHSKGKTKIYVVAPNGKQTYMNVIVN